MLERLQACLREEELRQEAGVALVYAKDAEVDDQLLLDVLQSERDVAVLAGLAGVAGVLDGKMSEVLAGEFLMGEKKQGFM